MVSPGLNKRSLNNKRRSRLGRDMVPRLGATIQARAGGSTNWNQGVPKDDYAFFLMRNVPPLVYPPSMAGASGRKQRARPAGHPLRAEVVAHHQRQRILSGAKEVIAERGYRQVAVADIVKSAAIARRF